jgi:signal transduction histidine kinase
MQKTIRGLSPGTILAVTFILSALPLAAVEAFPSLKVVIAAAPYIVFHNVAEFFSIMVSFSMFAAGWFTYEQSENQHALFLGTAFLAIGLMDFMHTMSVTGMPDFITPNPPNKSIQFWVAVRLLQGAAFLASAFVYPERPVRWLSKKVLMTSVLLVSFFVFTGITFFPAQMPTTFIPGVGLTPFKKNAEYLVIGLLCAAGIAYWRRMTRTGDVKLIYYLTAFVISIFSELVFAFYTKLYDTYNILGHVYKVASFSLIYYGVHKASVKAPYIGLAEVSQKLKEENIQRRELEKTLREAESRVRFFASQNLTAQETERKRIAGELHDGIIASLSGLKFRLEKIGEDMKQGGGDPASLLEIPPKLTEINNDIRRIMTDLRPSVLDDLGIVAALSWFCREYQKTYSHFSVENIIGLSEDEVPDALKTPIFRISQEALNNIAKYSRASLVKLSLRPDGEKILLTIEDNGQGFDPNTVKKGMGLTTMRERAELSGGTFDLETAEGKGTVVRAGWKI